MLPRVIGAELFARDHQGHLISRIATIFPYHNVIVTVPTIHFFQQNVYFALLDQERRANGLDPLTDEEKNSLRQKAVSLFVNDGSIQIRPDREMSVIFAADEVLQKLLEKSKIRFLHAMDPKVHRAVKRRGECWRITPLPTHKCDMKAMIRQSRSGIEGREIYYYSKETGTRWLTCHEFTQLAKLDDHELGLHLIEILAYSNCRNDQCHYEVDFFQADSSFRKKVATLDLSELSDSALRAAYEMLLEEFVLATPPELHQDDVDNAEWRRSMYSALVPHDDDVASEEELLGLGAEFFMQIEWLPGGHIDGGELILEDVPNDKSVPGDVDPAVLERRQARSLLFNLVREYGDLEYINVGRVSKSMARRPFPGGRRSVFVVEMKRRDSDKEILKIIRMQRWGVREHLDEGRPLLDALLNSEEYTEYILDRRLACRQLGMNLPVQVVTRKISEQYRGKQRGLWTTRIWSPYFERDYIHGVTTDIVPKHRLADREYALRFAKLLGHAAAPNIIVGRRSRRGTVIFDNGDEVLIEDENGLPVDIMVTDHTGAFGAYETDYRDIAAAYARPVNDRIEYLEDPNEFAEAYVNACIDHFKRIQEEYRIRRRAFDTLFADRPRDEEGSLAYRWECVLKRLDQTKPEDLQAAIYRHIRCVQLQNMGH